MCYHKEKHGSRGRGWQGRLERKKENIKELGHNAMPTLWLVVTKPWTGPNVYSFPGCPVWSTMTLNLMPKILRKLAERLWLRKQLRSLAARWEVAGGWISLTPD